MRGAAYLNALNSEQLSAVEHGVIGTGTNIAGPLLVIAGAGSGKTNTLAHRVAHLIVSGADAGRILLLTFSRRAAAEMERRAERIMGAALGPTCSRIRIGWSGTFHVVAARLLRAYAHAIGRYPSFTIHDREDSADLMNLVRHECGLSEKDRRFPLKATCLRGLFARGECQGAAQSRPPQAVPMVCRVDGRAVRAVRSLRGGQAAPARPRLRRSPAL